MITNSPHHDQLPPTFPSSPHTPRSAPSPPPDALINPYRNSTPLSRLPSLPPPPQPLDATKPGRNTPLPSPSSRATSPTFTHTNPKLLFTSDYVPGPSPIEETDLESILSTPVKLWPKTQTFTTPRRSEPHSFVIDRGTDVHGDVFSHKNPSAVLGISEEEATLPKRRRMSRRMCWSVVSVGEFVTPSFVWATLMQTSRLSGGDRAHRHSDCCRRGYGSEGD